MTKLTAVLESGGVHASENEPSVRTPAVPNGSDATSNPDSQAVGVANRKQHHGWRRVREEVASVLYATLRRRHGSIADWSRHLGVDAKVIAKWTAPELPSSPEVTDVLLMQREDAIAFLRALIRRLRGESKRCAVSAAQSAVITAGQLLAETLAALEDDHIDAKERARLMERWSALVEIGEQMQDALEREGR